MAASHYIWPAWWSSGVLIAKEKKEEAKIPELLEFRPPSFNLG